MPFRKPDFLLGKFIIDFDAPAKLVKLNDFLARESKMVRDQEKGHVFTFFELDEYDFHVPQIRNGKDGGVTIENESLIAFRELMGHEIAIF